MILVDVYVPSLDETFDCMLDENAEVEKIMMELFEMLSKKMKNSQTESLSEFMLYHMTAQKALEQKRSLASSGVTDGARLILV